MAPVRTEMCALSLIPGSLENIRPEETEERKKRMGGSVVESGCVAILINPSFSSTSNNGSLSPSLPPPPQKKKKRKEKRENVRTTSNEGWREKRLEPKVIAKRIKAWRLRRRE